MTYGPNWTDEDLFDEWRYLFNVYRTSDKVPDDIRTKFRDASRELRRRGVLNDDSPAMKLAASQLRS